jgi:hypothetical protein
MLLSTVCLAPRCKTVASKKYFFSCLTVPAPRRCVCSAWDGSSAVQPPGFCCTAYWEALSCAIYPLDTDGISGSGPARGWGSRPRSAHVPASRWWCRPIGAYHMCGFVSHIPYQVDLPHLLYSCLDVSVQTCHRPDRLVVSPGLRHFCVLRFAIRDCPVNG